MDWNQAYIDRNTPWDKGEPSPVISELASEIPQNANVIVPGCGTGNDILAVQKANPSRITCIDIAEEAISAVTKRFRTQSNVYPVLGDFMEYSTDHPGSTDVIIEHTCFCAIPVELRSAYAAASATLLRPGGKILGAFYWMPRDTDDITIGPPFQTSESELQTLFSPWFDIEIGVAAVGFPERLGREFRVVMIRKPDANDDGFQRSV